MTGNKHIYKLNYLQALVNPIGGFLFRVLLFGVIISFGIAYTSYQAYIISIWWLWLFPVLLTPLLYLTVFRCNPKLLSERWVEFMEDGIDHDDCNYRNEGHRGTTPYRLMRIGVGFFGIIIIEVISHGYCFLLPKSLISKRELQKRIDTAREKQP